MIPATEYYVQVSAYDASGNVLRETKVQSFTTQSDVCQRIVNVDGVSNVRDIGGYTVDGGSIAVGKASTDSVVMSSVLILFSDLVLTQLLMG